MAVEDIDYPKLEIPREVAEGMGIKQAAPHAVVLKLVATNICGSDQHMVRGRTTAPQGQTLGHEITGEVEVTAVRTDKPITTLTTRVVRGDGVVAVEGTAVCWTMDLDP